MIILYILCGLLLLIPALLCIPLKAIIQYSDSVKLSLRWLFVYIQLIPKPEKKDKKQSKVADYLKKAFAKLRSLARGILPKRKKAPKPSGQKPEGEKKKGGFASLVELRGFSGAITLLLDIAHAATGAFAGIFRGIVIERLDLDAKIGGEDAAQAAINYGKWCSVIYPAVSLLLCAFRRHSKSINIAPDFLSDENTMSIHLRMRIIPIHVIAQAVKALAKILWKELRTQINDKIKEKMSAQKEAAQQ